MNIVTISQLIDTHSLSKLDAGATIVTRLNVLLNAEQQIDLDYTGCDIYQRYTELPADLRLTVYTTEILDNAEAIELTNDVAVLTKHDKLITQKDNDIKISTLNGISITLVLCILMLCGMMISRGNSINAIHHTPLVTAGLDSLLYVYDYIVDLGTSGGP